MLPYSPESYISTLRFRQGRTILVEGRWDRLLILSLIHCLQGHGVTQVRDIEVDTAEVLQSVGMASGNREKVEYYHDLAFSQNLRLAAMVDREYRDFGFCPRVEDMSNTHRVIEGSLFWTRGHSIENYFIEIRNVINILATQFLSELPPDYDMALARYFVQIVYSTSIVTLAARHAGLLKRFEGISTPQFWIIDESGDIRIQISIIESLLRDRGIDDSALQMFKSGFDCYYESVPSSLPALHRWVAHGHIGMQMIWAGVAKVIEIGIDTQHEKDRQALLQSFDESQVASEMGRKIKNKRRVVNDIANGQWERRMETSCAFWAGICVNGDDEQPTALIDWISSL